MRCLIIILFLVCSFFSYGQTLPPTPGTSSRSTASVFPEDYNISVRGNFILPRYIDTIQANSLSRLDTASKIIFTTSDNKLWVRKNSPKRWVEIVSGQNSGGLSGGNLGLGYRIYNPNLQGVKTLFRGYGIIIDSSWNTNGLTFIADTSVLFPAIRATIPIGVVYTGSNGITKTVNDFRLGGNLSQNTIINANGFNFGVNGLPISDTASYDLSVNTLGEFLARPIGQSNVYLSQALTSSPTLSGADSIHFTGEVNPWPMYTFYGRLGGDLGTQNLNTQNVYDGGMAMNKRNAYSMNGYRLGLDSGGLVIKTNVNNDTILFAGGLHVNGTMGATFFYGNSLIVNNTNSQFNRPVRIGVGSRIEGPQNMIELRRTEPGTPQYWIGVKVSNDNTAIVYPFPDSTGYKMILGAFTNSSGIETDKWYVNGRGWQWAKQVPFAASVSSSDTVLIYKNGFYTGALVSSLPGGGGGGSGTVTSVATGYGLLGGPVTTSGTILADTTNQLTSKLSRQKLADSLAAVLTITENSDFLTKTGSVLGTNTAFQSLIDGATITFTTANGVNGRVTLGGNRTLSIPSPQNGLTYSLKIFQDGTGGRTLTLPGGFSAVLRASANDSTFISGTYDGTNGSWIWLSDYSVAGATVPSVISVSSNTTLSVPTYQFNIIEVDASVGPVTLTLPTATSGKGLVIKKIDSSANAVNITTAEGTLNVTAQWGGWNIYANGTNWKTNGTF